MIDALMSPHINGAHIALCIVAMLIVRWGVRRDERKNARQDAE